MKEFDPSRLTNRAPQLTLRSGRSFMPGEGSASTETAERPAVEATVGHLRRAAARSEEKERDASPEGGDRAKYERLIERALEKGGLSEEEVSAVIAFKDSLGEGSRESLIVDDIERTRDPERRMEKIEKHLKEISPHQPHDPRFLRLVTEGDYTLDYFVNRIVAQPWDAETSDYRLSFYGNINLEFIRDILRTKKDISEDASRRYRKLNGIVEASELFHGMNRLIVTGQLPKFVDTAPNITYQQLQVIQDLPGVAQVMRFFDEEFNRLLARDDYIKDTGNYAEMMGFHKDKEGRVSFTGGLIEKNLKKLVEDEVALGSGGGLGNLEQWQINLAFQAGKLLTNLTLRAAEMISLGKPKNDDEDDDYASFPQEPAANFMNFFTKKGLRFSIGEVRYGVKLAKMTREIYKRDREKQGYGKINITAVASKDIEDFEDAGILGFSGIWSSWRQNEILLKKAPIRRVNGFRSTSLKDHIEELEKDLKHNLKATGASKEEIAKQKKAREAEFLRRTFLDESGSLRQEINAYLGILLKHRSVTPKEVDSKEVIEVKQKIREEIWKRAAQENPLGVAPFLMGVKGRLPDGFVDLTKTLKEEGGVWDSLRGKIRTAHERRLAAINRGEANTSLDRFIRENGEKVESLRLTPAEQRLLEQIRSNGKLLSVELAKIRMPFDPFMNDVIFERAEYGEAGGSFFQRRTAGDISNYYKASENFTKFMDNPGVHTIEEITAILLEMVEAIGIPNGIDAGQDKIAPFAEAMLEYISCGSHIEKPPKLKILGREVPLPPMPLGLLKWFSNSEITKFISNSTNRGNSMAQMVSGTKALSINEFGREETLNLWLHKGVLRKAFIKDGVLAATDLYNEFRKKFKTKLPWLILAFLRTFLPVFLLGATVETGKRTYQGK